MVPLGCQLRPPEVSRSVIGSLDLCRNFIATSAHMAMTSCKDRASEPLCTCLSEHM